jgi:signal transduction histidine kinase
VADSARDTRLRDLVDAGIGLSSELTLDAVLQRLADAARHLIGARYAAVGVLDEAGEHLEEFVTSGIDADARAEIGDLPSGRGILGVLISEPRPLRLSKLSDDPRSSGFPAKHPPMASFLGVPVLIRGAAFGSLYLTEKVGANCFSDADEEVATLLAAQAAVAVENARLYEASRRWNEHLEALGELGDAITRQLSLEELLPLACSRLRDLVGAGMVSVMMPDEKGLLRTSARVGKGAEALAAVRSTRGVTRSKNAQVFARGRLERVDSMLDDPEVDQDVARRANLRCGLYVPLLMGDSVLGVLSALNKENGDNRFSDTDVRLAESFATRLSAAIELTARVERDSMSRVVRAQEGERRRLARELHDETGQAVTSIILGIGLVEAATTLEDVREACSGLRDLASRALDDVRRIAFELRPRALDDHGLGPAIDRLAEYLKDRAELNVDVEVRLDGRLDAETESAVYRVVQEALTNVVKHANSHAVSVLVTRQGTDVVALVEDDGDGFNPSSVVGEHMGLTAMQERVSLLGGTVTVESRPGSGTLVQARLPLPI